MLIDEKKGKKFEVWPIAVESVLNAESEILLKRPILVDKLEIDDNRLVFCVDRFEPITVEKVDKPVCRIM